MKEITEELKEESRRVHATIAEAAETIYDCARRLGQDVSVEAWLGSRTISIKYDKRGV